MPNLSCAWPPLVIMGGNKATRNLTQQGRIFMNQTHQTLSSIWHHIQDSLFPWLQEELGPLTKKQQLVEVLEVAQIEKHLPYVGQVPGRPIADRGAIARAFVAKAVYNMATTEILIDRLNSDIKLRRLCGWEKTSAIPSQSTFSRSFAEFAHSQLAERVHTAIIDCYLGDQLIGHIARDSTTIVARGKTSEEDSRYGPQTE